MAISGGDGSIILTTKVDESGINSGLSKIKSGIGRIGKAFAVLGGAGAAAFVGISKAAIDSYADYEQLAGGVETLFKDSAKTLMNYADQAYKTAGMSANQYMEGVTSFSASMIASVGGDTAKAAELSNQAMIAISDNANKMGTDMEMIVQTYQSLARGNVGMLDNLKLGYGGTKAELERLIEDAEAYKKSMGEIVDYDASNFADVTQAIQTIQEKLGIAGATAQEASTTIQGSLMQMKASWQNLLTGMVDSSQNFETLIQNLVLSIGTLASNLLPAIVSATQGVLQAIEALLPEIPKFLEDLMPVVLEGASGILSGIISVLPEIVNSVSSILPELITEILNMLPEVLEAGIQILLSLIQGLTQALPQLIAMLPEIINTIITVLIENLPLIIEAGIQLLIAVVTGISEAIPLLIDYIPTIIDTLITTLLDNLPLIIDCAIQLLVALINGLIQALPQLVAMAPQIISTIVTTLIENLPQLLEAGKTLLNSVIDGIKSILSNIIEVGKNIVKGLWDGIKNAKDWLLQKIREWCGSILNGIKSFFGIASPAKELIPVGKFIVQGMAVGIEKFSYFATDAIKSLVSKIKNEARKEIEDSNDDLLNSEILYAKESYRIKKEREEKSFLEDIAEIDKKYNDAIKKANGNREEIEKAELERTESIEKLKRERIEKIRKEAEDEYLDTLKENAEKERKVLEENQKTITDMYYGMTEDAIKSIKNLLKNQESLAKKLFDFGDLYTVVEEVQNAFSNTFPLIEKNKLANPAYKAQTLQRYYDKLMEVKERGVPDEFFDMLKNMGYEEGLEYALKLLQLGDKQFKDYIKNWVELQKTGKSISEALFGNGEAEKDSKKILADISEQTDAVENYFDLIMQIKNKDNVPKAFFESLRDMGVAEGTEYANALLGLSDEEFQKYIADWARDKSVSEEISKMLYADEAGTIASEITEAFEGLDSKFFGLGEDAFVNFGKGFVEKMKTVVEGMKTTIGSTFKDILPFGDIVTTPFAIPSIANGGVVPYSATRMLPFGGIYSGYSAPVPYDVSYNGKGTTTVILQVNERELGRVTLDAATLESERVGTTFISK